MTAAQHDVPLTGLAVREGLSWSWSLDFETLLTTLSEPAPWNHLPSHAAHPASPATESPDPAPSDPEPLDPEPLDPEPLDPGPAAAEAAARLADPVEADFADYLDALDAGRSSVFPLSAAAGRVAEVLPTSPDLAAWLACNAAGDLEDGALPGVAAAYRRLAAWAQAGELAVVAEMASRSAAEDDRNGVETNGRPGKISASATGQVALALTMSQSGAEWWTGLAVDLQWRLSATGAALRSGTIDLPRAKAIAEATAPLDDDKAQAVEAKVLPRAGEQTTGQLRASLRRAVITADPEGAERRREEAEKRAKVTLYPDAEGTASLAGQSLPGIRAAAAMARITALARALKASGVDGGIDLLRSKVFLGLLLGTLPHIPPPPGSPPDAECPPGTGPGSEGEPDASSPHLDDWPWNNDPDPTGTKAGARPGTADENPDRTGEDSSASENAPPAQERPEDDNCQPGGRWPGADEDDPGCESTGRGADEDDPGCEGTGRGPMPWPEATPLLPPGPAALKNLPPAGGGLLDLRLPWLTLARGGPEPGYITRLGAITPAQASYVARLAARDPSVEWRVVLVDSAGWATAVTRVKSGRSSAGPARAGPESCSSLLQRVTVIISADEISAADGLIAAAQGGQPEEANLARVLAAIIAAAQQAAARATERAAADTAAGGCAHTQASPAYQVPARLREFVTVRDLTCRFGTCRQPAWRCDLDHSQPYDQDGLTCSCNLGALCRHHHKLKQHSRWRLDQPEPGTFIWTTPAGRTYTTQPDQQVA